MDLAQITNWLQTLWQKCPHKRVTQVLSSCFFIYIAYWFAHMTWLLIPTQSTNNHMVTGVIGVDSKQADKPQANIQAISQLNLFGKYNDKPKQPKPVEQIESAPQTRLRLTLTGLVASDKPQTAAAIIESNGRQETYGIDDKIEGTQAVLKKVLQDRVIIEASGRLETLMLDGGRFDYAGEESDTGGIEEAVTITRKKIVTCNQARVTSEHRG